MSRLTRDGTAEPVSRDQILRHARGQGNIIFPVQLTTSRIGNRTQLIHTLIYVMTIHTYIGTYCCTCTRSYMKTTVVINKCILYTVHDGMQSCGIKFCTSTFCRIWCYHFCCSPTKRGAPWSDVWKAESPTKRLCLPRSLNALARLLEDNHRRGYTRA